MLTENKNGGITLDGIAYAGQSQARPAMWFDGSNDYIGVAAPTQGILTTQYALCTMTLYPHIVDTLLRRVMSIRLNSANNQGWAILSGNNQLTYRQGLATSDLVYTGWGAYAKTVGQLSVYNSATSSGIFWNQTQLASGVTRTPLMTGVAPAYIGWGNLTNYFQGVIRDVRIFNVTGMTDGQVQAIIADPLSVSPAAYWTGYGVTNADWLDQGSDAVHNGTVFGSPEPAYITPAGKVIKGGVVMNP